MSSVARAHFGKTDPSGLSEYFREAVDTELERILSENSIVTPLADAISHAVFPRGKRIRPLLALMLCSDLNGDATRLMPAAAAIELVHSASLIHDDLPSLDNDDERRGRPTVHKAFGEATAVLAGDFLVPLAFLEISKSDYPDSTRTAFTRVLSKGYADVCNGQQLDVLPDNQRGEINAIHRLKTGSLFLVSTTFGALGGGLSGAALAAAQELGLWIGLTFQMADDLLDSYGSTSDRGRSVSSDARNKRTTFSTTANNPLDELGTAKQNIERLLRDIGDEIGASPGQFSGSRFVIDQILERAERYLPEGDCTRSEA